MPKPDEIPLSETPHSTRHTDPYASESHRQADGAHRPGERIEIADGKSVPGFQMRTSTGPLWRPLTMAKDEREMTVIAVNHGAEFQGIRGLTELECEIKGFDYTVVAYFRGERRLA
jgi:hypothetical protein